MCNGHEASVARPVPAPGSEFRSVLVTTGVKTAQRGLAGGRGQEGCATQAIERAGDGKCVTACSTARSSIGASGMKGNSLLVPAPGFSFYGDFVCLAYFGSVKSNCARPCLVGPILDVQNLHSARFRTVVFRLYL
jgi:hypothetical protein